MMELRQIYEALPSLDCGSCWGDCCVSPTVTAVEFVELVETARSHEETSARMTSLPREHHRYPGNFHCRFQHMETGRCLVYPGRGLGCRLHGHDVLKSWNNPEMEICDREPGGRDVLARKELDIHLEALRELNRQAGIEYCEPYYLFTLNLECWFDLWNHPQWMESRPSLHPIQKYLAGSLGKANTATTTFTTLEGKLTMIDRFGAAVESGDADLAHQCLQSLLHDFPSTGSYWTPEARQFLEILSGKSSAGSLDQLEPGPPEVTGS